MNGRIAKRGYGPPDTMRVRDRFILDDAWR